MQRRDNGKRPVIIALRQPGEINPIQHGDGAIFRHRPAARHLIRQCPLRHALDRIVVLPVRPRRERPAGHGQIKLILKIKQAGVLNATIGIIEHASGAEAAGNKALPIIFQPGSQRRTAEIEIPILSAIAADRVSQKNRIRQRFAGNLRLRPSAGSPKKHMQRFRIGRIGNHCRIQHHLIRPRTIALRTEEFASGEVQHNDP
ncbi:hypothetical protein SDC9_98826 [bioreactor metagenome]|uniref:Uncharacterized protein n=1 Tax=bioreactor metagenome TaxID=1076179 RepID=A0A645AML1_9ZZZZ